MKLSTYICTIVTLGALLCRAELDSAILTDEAKLIALIQATDTSDNDRVTACQNLGWYGTKNAIAPLVALLASDKPHIRHAARYGLEMIPDPTIADALCDAAANYSGAALTGIVQSLGTRGNERAVDLLAKLANGSDATAAAAIQALGKLATPKAVAALAPLLGKNPLAAPAWLTAVSKIETTDPRQAAQLYAQLRGIKENVAAPISLAALRGQIVTKTPVDLPLWQASIASSDEATVAIALCAVLDAPAKSKYTKTFAAALAKHPNVQCRLASLLGVRGDRAAVSALLKLAKGEQAASEWSSLAAAGALATLNDPAAMTPLLALSTNPDKEIAEAAQNEIMGFAGTAADKAVLTMMKKPEAATRLTGIDMALRRRMKVAVPVLASLVGDRDPKVSEAAVKGLGELGSSHEIPELLAAIKRNPESDTAIRALSALCSRYARPRSGKTVIKSALYGSFEHNLVRDVTENVQKVVDAGSITIQATGRLCRWDGFSEDPAPGKLKTLRLVYTFDGLEKSAAVLENDSYHLSGVTLLPEAINPISAAFKGANGSEKTALFKVFMTLANDQALTIARDSAAQSTDQALQESAIRALIDWKTPTALDDVGALVKNAPNERLKILALRGFVRQLELAFTVPNAVKVEKLKQVRAAALRDEDRTFVDASLAIVSKLLSDEGFTPIFDGKSLKGWKGGGGWWQAKDGILQAQSSTEKPCKQNSHLIWTGGTPADFELRAEFKLSPSANSGIQVRSQDNEFADSGYQADMEGTGKYVGYLYHPKQHLVGERGAKVTIAADGKKTVERFADAQELGDKIFKKDDWNEYTIIARGPSITIFVNGTKTNELIDHRPEMMPKSGFITLQMHAGPPMKIQFRNLRVKNL